MPDKSEATRLWAAVEKALASSSTRSHRDFNGAHDFNAAELERLACDRMLRAGPGGRAIAGLREPGARSRRWIRRRSGRSAARAPHVLDSRQTPTASTMSPSRSA